mmetsp:Transcript_31894/g.83407  ORF Transcript_31894/g.83407 Transcript_31894/m.83407 type:complete len:570 (+) Transcript_31894:113-1822(+)
MADTPEDKEALAAKRLADKERKKAEKEEKQRQKEANQKKRGEGQKSKDAGEVAVVEAPTVTLRDYDAHNFGDLFIQSHVASCRSWTKVDELTPALAGQKVWVRGRVATSRKQGKMLCFLQLRESMHTAQAVVFSKDSDIVPFAAQLPRESVVDVYGEITVPAEAIASCSQSGVELQVQRLFCVSRSVPELPLQLEDASRSDTALAADPELPRVNQDVRLNNRIIDLRTPANQAIFRMQSGVCQFFRGFLRSQGFTEIHTPKLVGTASEGGADVFKVEYFGGAAYMAQSPQLYKQMALMADLERVFEVGPVFRAENSYTHRHMTEFTGLDLEMCFCEHYHEVIDILDRTFNAVFDGLNEKFTSELDVVRAQHPFENLRYRYPCLRFSYPDAMALLRTEGPKLLRAMREAATDEAERSRLKQREADVAAHGDLDDIGTEDEKLLGEVIANLHGQDFYIIDKFPAHIRPFYTMPDPHNPELSNSYDIFIRGEEVTSGAQRIHDPQLLLEQAAAKEPPVDLSPIQAYVDSFKFGAFPHAGGGVGLERVVMLFCGLPNIRKTSLFPRDPKRLSP